VTEGSIAYPSGTGGPELRLATVGGAHIERRADSGGGGGGGTIAGGGGGPHDPGVSELIAYRLDQFEKRADGADARMARVEEKLGAIQLTLAGVATKDNIRNWGLVVVATVVGTVVATALGVGAMVLQSTGNQLSAFQAGLSAIQTAVAAQSIQPAVVVPPKPAPTRPEVAPAPEKVQPPR
jgi:hypothetical protein